MGECEHSSWKQWPKCFIFCSISDFPCDSKQMTHYPSFALNSCLLSPPQPYCPPLTFPNMVLLHWTSINNSMIYPDTVFLCDPCTDLYSTVLVLLIPAQMPKNFVFFMLFFGIENGKPLQYFCLENSTDGEAWQATGHGVPKSRTWLSIHTSYFFCFPSRCCELFIKTELKNNDPSHCVMQTRGDLCLQTKREHIATGISYSSATIWSQLVKGLANCRTSNEPALFC